MICTLILPICSDFPRELLKEVLDHYSTTTWLRVVVVCVGDIEPSTPDIITHKSNKFNLAVARNVGLKSCTTPLIAYSDADTILDIPTLKEMCDLIQQSEIVCRGRYRRDLHENGEIGEPYQCGFAPLVTSRAILMSLGGFCIDYVDWGYEDSDMEHKFLDNEIPIVDFVTPAIHLLKIHSAVSTKSTWRHSSDHNRQIFDARIKLPIEDRIMTDLFNLSSLELMPHDIKQSSELTPHANPEG